MIKKILRGLFIVQERSNIGRNPKLGKGYSTAYRFNPYNPLSYITVVIALIIGITLYGILGFWKEMDKQNPFKWN